MLTSLDRLVTVDKLQSIYMTNVFNPDQSERDMLLIKGIYLCEYVDYVGSFYKTELPSKDKFYSKLHEACISDDYYHDVFKVWSTFECRL